MRLFRFIIATLVTGILVFALNTRIGAVPPIGKLLNPFTGFWQNAESSSIDWPERLNLEGLSEPVQVIYDDRLIPHIFAQNDQDLYYAQGYIEARHRLWQMDFMSRLASGQLSAVVGQSVLNIDRFFRRMGMPKAIEETWHYMEQDPNSREIMLAYTKGVNAYIRSLATRNYPIEFKLLDYQPTLWTPERSLAIFKLMSFNLIGYDDDVESTNTLAFFGEEDFKKLYDLFPDGYDPIIPDTSYTNISVAAIDTGKFLLPESITAWQEAVSSNPHNGSNNWAVHGSRTASGYPLLANDPHLGLNLPAIWYEQQHHSPSVNAYGVSLPGSPLVILGFNENIAWGFTNAGRDVKDWYRLTVSEDGNSYLFDSTYRAFTIREELIQVRGMGTIKDSVKYTHFGPVTYDAKYRGDSSRIQMALRWKAHDPSNEISAVYSLNRATDYNSYTSAIAPFTSPGQNIIFADRNGDVAITQQGSFPVLWPGQGRFISDGSKSNHQWQGFIPNGQNPHHRNPERGFVSSANQQATDESYPYYYSGSFQHFRNRRINDVLTKDSAVTIEDMMALQNDNYHLKAEEALSVLLPIWQNSSLSDIQNQYINNLTSWDLLTDTNSLGAVYWDAFWEAFTYLCTDELRHSKAPMLFPDSYHLIQLMAREPNHWIFDIDSTEVEETLPELSIAAINRAIQSINDWQNLHESEPLDWTHWKNTTMTHWLRSIPAFNLTGIAVGGDADIVNANSATHGASWRLIAHLKPEGIEAYGIYAGGQSGNPGSPYYGQFVENWAAGEYYKLLLLDSPTTSHDRIIFRQTFE